jgi:hypothetical protein
MKTAVADCLSITEVYRNRQKPHTGRDIRASVKEISVLERRSPARRIALEIIADAPSVLFES